MPLSYIPVIHCPMYLCICNDACFLLPSWSQAMSNGHWHWWGWVLRMILWMPWWVLFSTHLLGCHLMPPWPCDPWGWGRSSCWMMDLWLINPGSWLEIAIWSTPMIASCRWLIAVYLILAALIPSPASKISCLSNLQNALKFFQLMGFCDDLASPDQLMQRLYLM